MILKRPETHKTTYNLLDLLGSDEVALSKAFSFLLASDSDSYFHFLRFLGIPIKNTLTNYKSASIITEKKRIEGRTDIELIQEGKYHIIVECKIGKGKAIKQRTQYLNAFDNSAQKKFCAF